MWRECCGWGVLGMGGSGFKSLSLAERGESASPVLLCKVGKQQGGMRCDTIVNATAWQFAEKDICSASGRNAGIVSLVLGFGTMA